MPTHQVVLRCGDGSLCSMFDSCVNNHQGLAVNFISQDHRSSPGPTNTPTNTELIPSLFIEMGTSVGTDYHLRHGAPLVLSSAADSTKVRLLSSPPPEVLLADGMLALLCTRSGKSCDGPVSPRLRVKLRHSTSRSQPRENHTELLGRMTNRLNPRNT